MGDRYRLEGRLGAGGMSTVYLAVDSVLQRKVAVKLLAEHLAEDEAFVARFKREALAAARLTHPNVVQVYDSGIDDSRHYIVMEYVPGRSVAQLLKEKGRLDVDEAVDIVCQACEGLKYAHSKGIVHRDIKPGNLMIANDGTIKLADFGIAKAAEETRITQAGSVVGTAAYLSPEQAHGEEAGVASDIYSLGVVTYQLLAGRLPYEYSSLTELALKQQTQPLEPLPSLNDLVSPELDRAISRALARQPQNRFADAGEMAEALRKGAAGIAVPMPTFDETAATQMLGGREAQPELAPTSPTRALPSSAASGHTVALKQGPAGQRGAKKSGVGRFIALLLLLALIGTGAAIAVIASSSPERARKFQQVVEDTVQDQIQGLKDLIRENTQ